MKGDREVPALAASGGGPAPENAPARRPPGWARSQRRGAAAMAEGEAPGAAGAPGPRAGGAAGGALVPEGEARALRELAAGGGGGAPPPEVQRFAAALGKYQEQPTLLDPLLGDLAGPLVAALRGAAREGGPAGVVAAGAPGRMLYALAVVRGPKTVARFLPHEAADLEPALALLAATLEEGAGEGSPPCGWETQCTLLMWLSVLVLIPFALSTLDSALQGGGEGEGEEEALGASPMVAQMLGLCRGFLAEPGPVRDTAAALLGRLLTRPDTRAPLAEFVAWASGVVAPEGPAFGAASPTAAERQRQVFLVPGVARALAAVLKHGSREELMGVAPAAWRVAARLTAPSAETRNNALVRKLATKLVGRASLLYLRPQVAPWRYDRGSRWLLGRGGSAGSAAAVPGAEGAWGDAAVGAAEGDEGEVAEEVEEAIELLLTSLRDKDTVVRWSAAKCLGRVTERLPKDLADDVVSFLLDFFSAGESDGAWHGACLALAELARRGLLLPERLPAAAMAVAEALSYDVRRGPHSVGAHVRDAAAYACWAFARAYAPEAMVEASAVLAPALLVGSCYDREVHCRRAASAAFQEAVGRLGVVFAPRGLDILNEANYFSLAVRQAAYLQVGPFVGQFPEYHGAMAEHLAGTKLRHWEKSLRELAAKGLGALVGAAPSGEAEFVPGLLLRLADLATNPSLEVRHGALVGIGELLLGAQAAAVALPGPALARVARIVPDIEAAQLYRGKGGEIMREAVCFLVSAMAKTAVPLPADVQDQVHKALGVNLQHPNWVIQRAAAEAFGNFAREYCAKGSGGLDVVLQCLEQLQCGSVMARRGFALALGPLPAHLLAKHWRQVLGSLDAASRLTGDEERDDAEARVNAVSSLSAVSRELGLPGGCPAEELLQELDSCVLPCMVDALEDYTIDNRGDVGSWVREEAMKGLAACCGLRGELRAGAASPAAAASGGGEREGAGAASLDTKIVRAVAKQAFEKIDRVRAGAGACLCSLLHPQVLVPGAAFLGALVEHVAPAASETNWAAASASFPQLAPLLELEPFTEELLEGLVISAGGLNEALGQTATDALLGVLEEARRGGRQEAALGRILAALSSIFQRRQGQGRVTLPLLRTANALFDRGNVAAAGGAAAFAAAEELLECVRQEVRGCKDIPRLQSAGALLCHLSVLGEPTRSGAFKAVLSLLGNRYPRVRKHIAEQFYLRLLSLEDEDACGGYDEDELEAAMEVVADTKWDGPSQEDIRAARLQVYPCFRIEPPQLKSKAAGGAAKAAAGAQDENESYRSLVDAAGY